MRSASDLHAPARIRNAAIARFGRDGFSVGLRAIAADAGVSPALIVHQFGSKAGLQEACDEHVMAVIAAAKFDTVGAAGPAHMLGQLAAVEEYEPIAAYAVTSLATGGALARHLVERMTDLTAEFLAAGVTEGTIKPSRDPRARARFLVHTSLGMLLLAYRLHTEPGEAPDLHGTFAAVTDDTIGPALELYTEGLFTDRRYLDTYHSVPTPAPVSSDTSGDV